MHRELLNVIFWRFNAGDILDTDERSCHFYIDPAMVDLSPTLRDDGILCYSYNGMNKHGPLRNDDGDALQTIIGVYLTCPAIFGPNIHHTDAKTAILWDMLVGDMDEDTGDSPYINACNEHGLLRHDLTQLYRNHARGVLCDPEVMNISYPVVCRIEPASEYTTWHIESVLDPYTFKPMAMTL